MSRRARIALALVVVALVAGVVVGRQRRLRALAAAPTASEEGAYRFAFAWPRGKAYRYTFAWTAESGLALDPQREARAEGSALRGAVDLTGTLVLESYGPREGGTAFGVSVEDLGRHRLELLGADALGDDAHAHQMFDRRRAIADVGPDGAVRSMSFARVDPEPFKALIARLLAAVTITLPAGGAAPGGAWPALEEGPSGKARVAYALEPDARRLGLSRRRDRYETLVTIPSWMRTGTAESLVASASGRLDPAGYLRELVDDERLVVTRGGATVLAATSHVEVRLASIGDWDAPTDMTIAADTMETRAPGEHPVTKGTEEKLLDQRVAGLTATQLAQQVAIVAASPNDDDRNRWVSRASGLLLANPALCGELAAQFRQPGTGRQGRALILDLLAMAGTPEAQSAMRASLESPEARRDPHERSMLLQRFSFVSKPDPASVALITNEAKRGATEDERIAAQYTLGSAVKQLARAGDEPAARGLHAMLTSSLSGARTPAAKRASVAALGNAARAEDVPALVRVARDDDDATVRAAAAWALRAQPDAAAGEALVAAATDGEAQVGRAALRAIGARGLSDADARALSDAVAAGRTPKDADAALVNAVGARAVDSPDVRRALAAVLARSDGDPTLAARIRQLLAFAAGAE